MIWPFCKRRKKCDSRGRNRLGDLGRIAEQLDRLVNDKLWDEPRLDYNYVQMCEAQDQSPACERCWDDYYILDHIAQLGTMQDQLRQVWRLARYGEDERPEYE